MTLRGRPTIGVLPQTRDAEMKQNSHGDQVLLKLGVFAKDAHHAGSSSVIDCGHVRQQRLPFLIAYLDAPGKGLGDLCNHQILKDEKKLL